MCAEHATHGLNCQIDANVDCAHACLHCTSHPCPRYIVLPFAGTGRLHGHPDASYMCCGNIPKGAAYIQEFVEDYTMYGAIATVSAIVITGYSLLAYHTNSSPISFMGKKIYQKGNKSESPNQIMDKVLKAGLSLKALRMLPKEFLWTAIAEAKITTVRFQLNEPAMSN